MNTYEPECLPNVTNIHTSALLQSNMPNFEMIRTNIHACGHACTRAYILTYIHNAALLQSNMPNFEMIGTYIHIHTYMRACIHTYIHTSA